MIASYKNNHNKLKMQDNGSHRLKACLDILPIRKPVQWLRHSTIRERAIND
jgi:hypothetical protein